MRDRIRLSEKTLFFAAREKRKTRNGNFAFVFLSPVSRLSRADFPQTRAINHLN
jgi:hypothetical protein